MEEPCERLLELLRDRNRQVAASCAVTRSYQSLLAHRDRVQAQCTQQQQRAELLAKENHEMRADLRLLQQNEANAGVSRQHIELLQQQLERAKSELAHTLQEASRASTKESETTAAARQMAEKLAVAQADVADLRHRFREATALNTKLQEENERLIQRVTELLQEKAKSMDHEVEAYYSEVERLEKLGIASTDEARQLLAAPETHPENRQS